MDGLFKSEAIREAYVARSGRIGTRPMRRVARMRRPSNVLARGDAASIRAACSALRAECGAFPNFVLSSGCDIPVAVPWENLETFFRVAQE
jgi:hypothetical protein